MTRILPLLFIALALPALAQTKTLEQRIQELKDAGASDAKEVPNSAVADPIFPDITIHRVTYRVQTDDVAYTNTIAVEVDKSGNARYQTRLPSVLAEKPEPPEPIGTESEIHTAITDAGNPKIEKMVITYGDGYADVSGYSEVNGKLTEVQYHVTKDDKSAWVVKPYDIQSDKELLGR
jgi:hypothetical protein